jgi:hypothetical protein
LEPAPGEAVTVDSATLELSPGVRLLDAELTLAIRASVGGARALRLPPGARVQQLLVDGVGQPFFSESQTIDVPYRPGSQTAVVKWQQPQAMGVFLQTPEVGLGGPASNLRVKVVLPDSRWLLFVGGPAWGPAILLWVYVSVILVGAFVLGRTSLSPLRTWQWVLFGFGLTQLPAALLPFLVGWFFLVEWRSRAEWSGMRKALIQLALLGGTPVFLLLLLVAVLVDLVREPDVIIMGQESSAQHLTWYLDSTADILPRPWVLHFPEWSWRLLMLAWALWLSISLLNWLRWAFRAFIQGGAFEGWQPRGADPNGGKRRKQHRGQTSAVPTAGGMVSDSEQVSEVGAGLGEGTADLAAASFDGVKTASADGPQVDGPSVADPVDEPEGRSPGDTGSKGQC